MTWSDPNGYVQTLYPTLQDTADKTMSSKYTFTLMSTVSHMFSASRVVVQKSQVCLLYYDRADFCCILEAVDLASGLLRYALSRLMDESSFGISRLPLPACLQSPSKLEAWEDMRFGIDDDRV